MIHDEHMMKDKNMEKRRKKMMRRKNRNYSKDALEMAKMMGKHG